MAENKINVEEVMANVEPKKESIFKRGINKGKAVAKKHWKKGVAVVGGVVGGVVLKKWLTKDKDDNDVTVTVYDDGSYTVSPVDSDVANTLGEGVTEDTTTETTVE